jgi:hypothetical protein
MAVDQKISQLPEALTLAGEDVVPIVQVSTGLNKKVKVSTLLQDAGFIKDIVVLTTSDTILELGKINWVTLISDHTMSVPTADASNLGEILIVNNRSIFELTITGVVVTPLILNGVNSIVGLVCVTNGYSYGWEVFSRYNIGDFDLISQTITNSVTTKAPSEDAVFDALALKEDFITKNALTTPLVWTSANGVASFQPIPVLGDLTYYLTNTSSDVATYYKQTTSPQVALTSLPFASVTNGQLLATFISEPNNPNRTSIPNGQYLNHLHLGKTGGTKDLQVRAEIWETTSAGVDIIKLADLGPSSILVGSGSTEYIIGYNTVEKTLSAVTSRIATKLYAVVGVSGSAPSISIFQGDGSDSRSNLPAPIVDATNYVPFEGALNDVDLGSKKITAQDVIVSSATASRIASLDASKKIVSLDTATYPSLTELSYVKGVTGAIQTQIDAKSTAYAIPNYYRVDLNLGDDVTGVAGRTDKPYATLQAVWDLIANGSTAEITIEIEGDYTFITHAINTSVSKDNIVFKFLGKITYAVPATSISKPLFTFTGTNNNLTFIVPYYTQTTQGGFIYAVSSSGHRYLFDNLQVLQGVNTSSVYNWGFYAGGGLESYFICNSLTVNITNDASGILGYYYPFQLVNCNYKITTFKITGTPTVSNSRYSGFYGGTKSIYIENFTNDNGYTNLTYFNIADLLTCDNVTINNLSIAANGSTQKASNTFTLFNSCTIKNLTINTGSILNYSVLYNGATNIQDVHLGNITINGVIFASSYLETNIHLHGTITRTVAHTNNYPFICLGNKGQINGNGNKIIYSDNVYLNGAAIIEVSPSVVNPKATLINDLTLYNTAMPVGNVQTFVPIMYYFTYSIKLRLRNLVVSSNVDFGTDPLVNNTHANTSFLRPYNENTTYICRVEGNVATNYLQNVTNLTNNCNVELINGYTL